ncbi:MAG: transporter substrate-binding domain-containing protein [Leptolyngbyaceae cyanobacterium]
MRLPISIFGTLLGMYFATSPVAFSADLETIRERGYLVVAVKDNWRPLGFRDDNGNLVGLEIDIATRLAEALFADPTAVQLVPVTNRDRLAVVLADKVDVAIAGVAMTPMRERVVSFSTPYYLDGTAFLTPTGQALGLQDLTRSTIALISGSEAVAHVHYTLPDANLIGVDSYLEAYGLMESGQVEAIAADLTVLTGWVQEYSGYQLLPTVLTAEPLAVVLPEGQQYDELRRFINTAIDQWHTDGWLEERATVWGLP